jgi:hypothetical protein
MKKLLPGILVLLCIPLAMDAEAPVQNTEPTLVIRWQHTVCQNENPCERCINTPLEIQRAYKDLKASLTGLGIVVTFEEKKMKEHDDHIFINDHDITDLLEGETIRTACLNCLDDKGDPRTCNTLKLGDNTYEVIPAELIIKAGLVAASELVTPAPEPPCGEKKSPCKGCPYSQ